LLSTDDFAKSFYDCELAQAADELNNDSFPHALAEARHSWPCNREELPAIGDVSCSYVDTAGSDVFDGHPLLQFIAVRNIHTTTTVYIGLCMKGHNIIISAKEVT